MINLTSKMIGSALSYLIFFFFCLLYPSNIIYASPWVHEKNLGSLSQSIFYEDNFKLADNNPPISSRYKKLSYQLYLEYSVSDYTAFGIKAIYSKFSKFNHIAQLNSITQSNFYNLDTSEFFITHNLYESKSSTISYRIIVNLPIEAYSKDFNFDKSDRIYYQANLSYGYKSTIYNHDYYITSEIGTRKRNHSKYDELYIFNSINLRLTNKFSLLTEYTYNKTINGNFQYIQEKYLNLSNNKIQYSLIYDLSYTTSLQLGYYHNTNIANTNKSYNTSGLVLSLWYNF